jgi:YggT family protein
MQVLMLLYYLLEILKWLIIARALMSWFVSPYSNNPVARVIRTATDPILRPLSELIPPLGGMDITPLIAFFVIHLTQTMLVRL